MARLSSRPNFSEYRTVSEAASYLGVSTATLRNWDRSGKLKPRRHPQNGYRIYLHDDLESILRAADPANRSDNAFAPMVDWSEMGEAEHFVQFYENDEFLIDSVCGFASAALSRDGGSIVVATANHRSAIAHRLRASGVDLDAAVASGRFVELDAAETLSKFMVGGAINRHQFNDTVGAMIARMSESCRHIHAFGEMVALLWSQGDRDAAIALEEIWSELSKKYRFALFCAYPIAEFDRENQSLAFHNICSCHTRVIPAESYAGITSRDQRLRAISLLQQKAQSLEAEIDHRRAAEDALARRERELADFFENAIEGLHKVGPDGTILWANKADYTLLGYSADEYIGRSITEFHVDSQVIEDMLNRLRRGETLENFPARLRCKNGQIKHVRINSNACFEDDEFAYTRCFTRDVTRQVETENHLHNADRRKDEFLATLAHELRNPLAPLRNALEVMKFDSADKSTIEEARKIMERQVDQMSRLVDDLMDVSRITRDKLALRKERVELAAVLNGAVETRRPLIDAGGHELSVTLPAQPLFLDADPTRMAQIFSNLLNNSAKYTEDGGKIAIVAERQGNEAVVAVRDNGVGISCEALAHVFDMFRQLDGSLERAQGGLGIGLTLVRRLVELHGGSINAQSEGPGKGSEFVVRLPLAPRQTRAPKSDGATKSPAATKRRIMVVDDNHDSAETMSVLLRTKGHEVCIASDGLEAIDRAAEFLPDVILMDVGMPKLNGYDATQRLRQVSCGKDALIIALTGWGQEGDVQRSIEAGCSAHLVKPVDLAALERLLESREGTTR
jgi:PAS domain S-box-containing protein